MRRRNGSAIRAAAAGAAVAAPVTASAQAGADGASLAGWTLTPSILAGLLVLAALYVAGLARRRGRQAPVSAWRHAGFFGALATWLVALQSPLDALSDHSFFVHQVQHLLLQTIGPMLFMLAAPQGLLAAGTPAFLRRGLVAPIMSSRAVRALFGVLAQPWIAAFLLVASLYAWQWPPYHDRALLDEDLHYWMHASMLAAGLLFYWCVFDPRPAPLGARYGVRMNILWFATTANMLLGTALFLKGAALYGAYGEAGRLWGLSAVADESLGGLIMWIPGGMVTVPAFLVLLRIWNSREARLEQRRRQGIPGTARATSNRAVAVWLMTAAFVGLAATLGVGLIETHRWF